MSISSRKEKILCAVVDSYIVGCEPISSTEIKDRHLPELSSATIRNELAALEEMGYLEQPHTSAGRIPTAEAYKLYVDKLMPRRKLSRDELKIINNYFDRKVTEIDDLLRSTAKVISQITNLTGVAVIPDAADAKVESIKIVKLTDTEALVIIVTNKGILKDALMEIKENLTEQYFSAASSFITSTYQGRTLGEISSPEKIIDEAVEQYQTLFKAIKKIICEYARKEGAETIILEGGSKILEQPEYSNVSKAKAMIEMMETKNKLIPLIKGPQSDGVSMHISIAKDNEAGQGVPECAVVTASYQINGVNIGDAGVIGPIRMDYSKVVSVLDYIGKTINVLPDCKEKKDGGKNNNDNKDEVGNG